MRKSRRKLILESIGLACTIAIVALSIWGSPLVYNQPRLIALIAGCFAAGATFGSIVKDRRSSEGH